MCVVVDTVVAGEEERRLVGVASLIEADGASRLPDHESQQRLIPFSQRREKLTLDRTSWAPAGVGVNGCRRGARPQSGLKAFVRSHELDRFTLQHPHLGEVVV